MGEKAYTNIENDDLTEIIIVNICAELAHRNWSLKMLADKADLPYESVKKLISHKIQKPSFISIWQIAGALGCSVDKLAGRENRAGAVLDQISQDTSEIYRLLKDMDQLCKNALQ